MLHYYQCVSLVYNHLRRQEERVKQRGIMYEFVILCKNDVDLQNLCEKLQSKILNPYADAMILNVRNRLRSVSIEHIFVETDMLTHYAINEMMEQLLRKDEFVVLHPYQQTVAFL